MQYEPAKVAKPLRATGTAAQSASDHYATAEDCALINADPNTRKKDRI